MAAADRSESDPATHRLSDRALWASIAQTLRDVVLPSLADEWARSQTIQLIALVELTRARGEDPANRGRDELATALDSLASNPLVRDNWPGDEYVAAAAALTAAVGRADAAADEVRMVLRTLLVAQLDGELAVSAPLIDALRGRLPR